MEILYDTLKNIDSSHLSNFQQTGKDCLLNKLKSIDFNKLSKKSSVDSGAFLDVILYTKATEQALAFSFREDIVIINSSYFNIEIYEEEKSVELENLFAELLQGNYSVKKGYCRKDKLSRVEFQFNNQTLSKYNQVKKIGLFRKRIVRTELVKGVNLL